MSPLVLRVLSAVFGLIFFFLIYFFAGTEGVKWISALMSAWCIVEFSRIHFPKYSVGGIIHLGFIIWMMSLLGASILRPELVLLIMANGLLVWLTFTLWLCRFTDRISLAQLFSIHKCSAIGVFYVGLLPFFVISLLNLPNGFGWFITYIFIIFAVDTYAFFGGLAFGKNKFFVQISPNKTIMGSVFGFIGANVFAVLGWYFMLPQVPLVLLLVVTNFVALFAQTGDLFMSLQKRVADIKDTGAVIPGHGGFLDRLDGLFYASPIFYTFAYLMG